MYCKACGASQEEGAKFCEACGASLNATAVAPGYMNTTVAAVPVKRFHKSYLLIGVAVVAILLAVGGYFVLADSGGSPEQQVDSLLESLEKKDQAKALEYIVPYERELLADYIPRFLELLEEDPEAGEHIKSTENALESIDFTFDGMEYRTTIDGDIAEVFVTDGEMTVEAAGEGPEEVEFPDDLEREDVETRIVLVKESGEWYISISRTVLEGAYDAAEKEVDQRNKRKKNSQPNRY